MEAKQLDLFPWAEKVKAQPQKPKEEPKKPKIKPKDTKSKPKPKKLALKLIEGEIAYQCLECDEEPTIYDRLIPKAACPKCNVLLEVIDERIPETKTEERKKWL